MNNGFVSNGFEHPRCMSVWVCWFLLIANIAVVLRPIRRVIGKFATIARF